MKISRKELKSQRLEELIKNAKSNILGSIIGPFGLSPAMFKDIEGGNVTTLRNFKKGVVSDDSDREGYEAWQSSINNGVDRSSYEEDFNQTRKAMFKKSVKIVDGYTGEELPRDGRSHLDHIESVSSYEKDPRVNLYMNKGQASKTANSHENLTFTTQSINQSKGDNDLKNWATDEKKEKYGLKDDLVDKKASIAKAHKENAILDARIKKDLKELAETTSTESVKMGTRAALGMLFVDITNAMFAEVRDHFGKNGSIDSLDVRLKRIASRTMDNKEKYIEAFKDGLLSGALSNVVTYAINHFIKTAKNMVRIIREGFLSLVRAIKMLLYPPVGMTEDEAFRNAMKIFTTAVVTSMGIAFEETLSTMLLNMGVPYSGEISLFLTGLAIGLGNSMLIYMIDTILDSLENPYELECLNALIENGEMQVKVLNSMSDVLLSLTGMVETNNLNCASTVNTMTQVQSTCNSLDEIRQKLMKIEEEEKTILKKLKDGSNGQK